MAGVIEIVGLGAGDAKQLTLGVYEKLREAKEVWLRTERHPVVAFLKEKGIVFHSYDHFYERFATFADVYRAIGEDLLQRVKQRESPLVYAVPGHPLVAEATVQFLLQAMAKGEVRVEIVGGQSFLDPLFARLQVDPVEGLVILDGTALRREQLSPYVHTVICQVYDRSVASDVKLTLMEVFPDDYPVTLVTAVGIAGQERIRSVPLYELDRVQEASDLTLVYVPPAQEEAILNRRFERLREIVAALRGPEGCPWDREQTHASLRKYLLEETYETLEAIDDEDPEAMCEELGDLLLQIMLHAQIASETGYFQIEDVIGGLSEKLIRRHPHVFAGEKAENAQQVARNWREIKAREKKGKSGEAKSLLSGIPRALPALLYAWKLQKKAAAVGFDWENVKDVLAKVEEELAEVRNASAEAERTRTRLRKSEESGGEAGEKAALDGAADPDDAVREEIGDLLFAVVNLARFLGVDPEEALARTNRKFQKRFAYIEEKLREAGKTFSETDLAEMEKWWREAKKLPT
ncbi:nucleoside triphosphate pyrophosphohydrolase [Bacillaceae bacterium]